MKPLVTAYRMLAKIENGFQPIVLLLLRLWGWQFFVTGLGKLQHHEKVVGFFTSLHIPMPGLNAWFVGGVECFGGLLLLAGLGTRLVGLVLTINMLVAFLTPADDRAVFLHLFQDPDAFIAAAPFMYLLVALIVTVFGPGVFSLDWIIKKVWQRLHPGVENKALA